MGLQAGHAGLQARYMGLQALSHGVAAAAGGAASEAAAWGGWVGAWVGVWVGGRVGGITSEAGMLSSVAMKAMRMRVYGLITLSSTCVRGRVRVSDNLNQHLGVAGCMGCVCWQAGCTGLGLQCAARAPWWAAGRTCVRMFLSRSSM